MNSRRASAKRGRVRRRRRAAPGFSLIEILLAIALIGLVAALFIGGSTTLLRAQEPRPEDVFWQAVAGARQLAIESGRPVSLHVDRERKELVTSGPSGRQAMPWPGRSLELLSATDRRSILLGGELVETAVLPQVWFHPEGTCDAFRARLEDAHGRRVVLQVDPWTCAPVLRAAGEAASQR